VKDTTAHTALTPGCPANVGSRWMLQRPNKAQTPKLSPNDGTQRHPSKLDPWAESLTRARDIQWLHPLGRTLRSANFALLPARARALAFCLLLGLLKVGSEAALLERRIRHNQSHDGFMVAETS
jgi:hypothetical protein